MPSTRVVHERLCTILFATLLQWAGAGSFTEKAKLLASDGASFDEFGASVDISGNFAIVGAYQDDDVPTGSGSAYIYRSEDGGNRWPFETKLVAPDAAPGDLFGYAVAIDGNVALVGAPRDDSDSGSGFDHGSAYVYRTEDSGVTWDFQAKLLAPDLMPVDRFGTSVDINGNFAVLGAYLDDDQGGESGSAYVYRTGDGGAGWSFQAKLTAPDGASSDWFGWSVGLDGNLAIVGARFDDDRGFRGGSAYIYRTEDGGTTWPFQAKLVASDGASGDEFGFSVDISGNFAIVGAIANDAAGRDSGSAYIYRTEDGGNTWPFEAKLVAPDAVSAELFGIGVAIDGNFAIVGARFDDSDSGSAFGTGSAYVYRKEDGGATWAFESKMIASDAMANDQFGISVGIDGSSAIVGAWGDDDQGTDSGSAYIFHKDGNLCSKGFTNLEETVCCDESCDTCGGCDCAFQGFGMQSGADFCCPSAIIENDLPCERAEQTGCLLVNVADILPGMDSTGCSA